MSHPIPDTPLTRRALAIATEAHAGQTRDDDMTPYITHPIEVARIAVELHDACRAGPYVGVRGIVREIVYVVAVLHDAHESGVGYPIERIIEALGDLLPIAYRGWVRESLAVLDRTDTDGYLPYILGIRHADSIFPVFAKRADIIHNSADLKPGSVRADKYALALHILET